MSKDGMKVSQDQIFAVIGRKELEIDLLRSEVFVLRKGEEMHLKTIDALNALVKEKEPVKKKVRKNK